MTIKICNPIRKGKHNDRRPHLGLDDGAFIGVMLSSNPVMDDFSFELENEMFTKLPKKKTQARCHLLAIISESEVVRKHGSIKREFVNQIAEKIHKRILSSSTT